MSISTQPRQWHLDKTVSISHIVATLTAIAAILVFGSNLDTRVSLLEQAVETQQKDATEAKKAVREDLREISQKIDRLIERGGK